MNRDSQKLILMNPDCAASRYSANELPTLQRSCKTPTFDQNSKTTTNTISLNISIVIFITTYEVVVSYCRLWCGRKILAGLLADIYTS